MNAAGRIQRFLGDTPFESYRDDEVLRSAVERQFEIMGEALRRLRDIDPETAALVPEVKRIVGMRNVLAHGYAVVNDHVVWETATERVHEVEDAVARILPPE